ncbi:universal stress protein [Salarchaeum japonicum]|uniref:Universal stress protein n=1 Tax=Salarchaeum japonicum TaxID=555573 RepID=A0AAV3SZD9_9EURY|nr:universal stress protein [Salarchaeum japonicum]
MPFVVPFDGSRLSVAALVNARVHEVGFDNLPPTVRERASREEPPDITAVTVVPRRASYARGKGWLDDGEPFDPETVVERLRERVAEIAPNADFVHEYTDTTSAGAIGQHIRRHARRLDATTVFIGSENAGRIVTPVMSVGSRVSNEQDYNVMVVRRELSYTP